MRLKMIGLPECCWVTQASYWPFSTGLMHKDRRIQVIYFIMFFRVLTFQEDGTGDPLQEYTFPITPTERLAASSAPQHDVGDRACRL
jgi:hypothetical protein